MKRWTWIDHATSYEADYARQTMSATTSMPIAGFTRPLPQNNENVGFYAPNLPPCPEPKKKKWWRK